MAVTKAVRAHIERHDGSGNPETANDATGDVAFGFTPEWVTLQ
jgi:hypothetical protein